MVDQWLRNEASHRQITLKLLLSNTIKSGVRAISAHGTAYNFLHLRPEYQGLFDEIEYVIDDSHRNEILSQSHLIKKGRGKQQKILLEVILLAYEAHNNTGKGLAAEANKKEDKTSIEKENRRTEQPN